MQTWIFFDTLNDYSLGKTLNYVGRVKVGNTILRNLHVSDMNITGQASDVIQIVLYSPESHWFNESYKRMSFYDDIDLSSDFGQWVNQNATLENPSSYTNFDLSTLQLPAGNYDVQVIAKANNFRSSIITPSGEIIYNPEPEVEIVMEDGKYICPGAMDIFFENGEPIYGVMGGMQLPITIVSRNVNDVIVDITGVGTFNAYYMTPTTFRVEGVGTYNKEIIWINPEDGNYDDGQGHIITVENSLPTKMLYAGSIFHVTFFNQNPDNSFQITFEQIGQFDGTITSPVQFIVDNVGEFNKQVEPSTKAYLSNTWVKTIADTGAPLTAENLIFTNDPEHYSGLSFYANVGMTENDDIQCYANESNIVIYSPNIIEMFNTVYREPGTNNNYYLLAQKIDNIQYEMLEQTVKNIYFINFDTSEVTSMSDMFAYCYALENIEGLDKFDTSNVTMIDYMFANCSNLEILDLSNFDTSNVTTLKSMFYNCTNLTTILGITNWNTENVTNMQQVFASTTHLTELDLSGWDTSSVTTFQTMFNGSGIEDLTIPFDVSSATSLKSMFNTCPNLEILDLSTFELKSGVDVSNMFRNCDKIFRIEVNAGTDWRNYNVGTSTGVFTGCISLPNFSSTSIGISKAYQGEGGYFTDKAEPIIYPTSIWTAKSSIYITVGETIWIEAQLQPADADGTVKFQSSDNTITLSSTSPNTCEITGNFEGDAYVEIYSSIAPNIFTTVYINVAAPQVIIPENIGTNTDSITVPQGSYVNLDKIFYVLPKDSFDTSMTYIVEDSNIAELSKGYILTGINIGTTYVTATANGNPNVQSTLQVEVVEDTSPAKLNKYYARNLINAGVDKTLVNDLIFTTNSELCTGTKLDVQIDNDNKIECWYDTSTTEHKVILYCETGIEMFDTDVSYRLCRAGSKTNELSNVTHIDVTGLITDNMTSMSYMFGDLRKLVTITGLNTFNTSNATDMTYMFYYCSSLTSLDLSNFNTLNVTNMYDMFEKCSNLASLDLSNFNVEQVINTTSMFSSDANLQHIYFNSDVDWSKFNISSSVNMFRGCVALPNYNSANTDITMANTYIGYFTNLNPAPINLIDGSYIHPIDDNTTLTIENGEPINMISSGTTLPVIDYQRTDNSGSITFQGAGTFNFTIIKPEIISVEGVGSFEYLKPIQIITPGEGDRIEVPYDSSILVDVMTEPHNEEYNVEIADNTVAQILSTQKNYFQIWGAMSGGSTTATIIPKSNRLIKRYITIEVGSKE